MVTEARDSDPPPPPLLSLAVTRSEALEAELAALEAMLRPKPSGTPDPAPGAPPKGPPDVGGR